MKGKTTMNAIMVIAPYWHNETWVFDDPITGLAAEPFVAGIPDMINYLVRDIPNARDGFRLTFSSVAFPGHQEKVTWMHGDETGNWYRLEKPPMEGWLCPALFKYFAQAPAEIFCRADPLKEKKSVDTVDSNV